MMKKLLLAMSVAAGAITVGTSAFAEDKTPGSGPNPYSDCGIGAALFTETKWAAAGYSKHRRKRAAISPPIATAGVDTSRPGTQHNAW